MSEKFCVSHEVKRLIDGIITKYDLNPVIKYEPGSVAGDGYTSQTIAVSINSQKGTLDLFLKCVLTPDTVGALLMDKVYANEIYFYEVVYPAYQNFSKNRGDPIGFPNVPKCYGTLKNRIVAMENLKVKGFKLFERHQDVMNYEHIELVLKTFARFHAISFAFKDQDKEKYNHLVEKTQDLFSTKFGENPIEKITRGGIKNFLKALDPGIDREILSRCDLEDLVSYTTSADRTLNEFSILTQGDCWCTNMMFLYQDGDTKKPLDMALIDWQVLRPASPMFDISYFYLSIASEEKLPKTEHYLKFYHEELCKRIRQLGSNPESLYPYDILLKEWKQHCKYGFAMAVLAVRAMLLEKEDAFNLEEVDFNNSEHLENIYPKLKNEEEYLRRMRSLAYFMIKSGYL